MSYNHEIEQVVRVVGGVGAGIMVLGGLGAFGAYAYQVLHGETT